MKGEDSAQSVFRAQRERHSIRPTKSVLRRVLAAARSPVGVHDVVLLHHSSRRPIRAADEIEPPPRGGYGQIRPAVPARSLDREPLERRPAVRRVPLLAGRNGGGDETTGLEKLALQAGGDVPALIGRRDSEVERCRRRQRRTVTDFFAGSPAPVPEEILFLHPEDGLAPLLPHPG